MPPRVSLDSPLKSYFPNHDPQNFDSLDDVWWQGTEQIRSSHPHRRESSISDVISEWIADSDDFDGSLDQPGSHGGYLDDYAGETQNENVVEGESEGVIREDEDSDTGQNEGEVTNLPMPAEKRIGKGKEKEIATHLLDHQEGVNDKGEQILLPKAFPGFPADIERRRVLA